MDEYQRYINQINQMNQAFQEAYERDMLTLFHRFLNDSLCTEDWQDVCSKRGVDLQGKYAMIMDTLDEIDEEEF